MRCGLGDPPLTASSFGGLHEGGRLRTTSAPAPHLPPPRGPCPGGHIGARQGVAGGDRGGRDRSRRSRSNFRSCFFSATEEEEVGEGEGRRGVGYGEEEERLCAGEVGGGGEGEELRELKYSRGFSFICAIGRIDPTTRLTEV